MLWNCEGQISTPQKGWKSFFPLMCMSEQTWTTQTQPWELSVKHGRRHGATDKRSLNSVCPPKASGEAAMLESISSVQLHLSLGLEGPELSRRAPQVLEPGLGSSQVISSHQRSQTQWLHDGPVSGGEEKVGRASPVGRLLRAHTHHPASRPSVLLTHSLTHTGVS